METSHRSSSAILATVIVVGAMFLIQQGGFFRGAFTSQLTASIAADDVLFATDTVATSEETAMGRQLIASAH